MSDGKKGRKGSKDKDKPPSPPVKQKDKELEKHRREQNEREHLQLLEDEAREEQKKQHAQRKLDEAKADAAKAEAKAESKRKADAAAKVLEEAKAKAEADKTARAKAEADAVEEKQIGQMQQQMIADQAVQKAKREAYEKQKQEEDQRAADELANLGTTATTVESTLVYSSATATANITNVSTTISLNLLTYVSTDANSSSTNTATTDNIATPISVSANSAAALASAAVIAASTLGGEEVFSGLLTLQQDGGNSRMDANEDIDSQVVNPALSGNPFASSTLKALAAAPKSIIIDTGDGKELDVTNADTGLPESERNKLPGPVAQSGADIQESPFVLAGRNGKPNAKPLTRPAVTSIDPARYPNMALFFNFFYQTGWSTTEFHHWLSNANQDLLIQLRTRFRTTKYGFVYPFVSRPGCVAAISYDYDAITLVVADEAKLERAIAFAIRSKSNPLPNVIGIRLEHVMDDTLTVANWNGPFVNRPPSSAVNAIRNRHAVKWWAMSFFDGSTVIVDMWSFKHMPKAIAELLTDSEVITLAYEWSVARLHMQELWGGPPPPGAKRGWQDVNPAYFLPNTFSDNTPRPVNVVDVNVGYQCFISEKIVGRHLVFNRHPGTYYLGFLDTVYTLLGIFLPTWYNERQGRTWDVSGVTNTPPQHRLSDQMQHVLCERSSAISALGLVLAATGTFDHYEVMPSQHGVKPPQTNHVLSSLNLAPLINHVVLINGQIPFTRLDTSMVTVNLPHFCEQSRLSSLSDQQKEAILKMPHPRKSDFDKMVEKDPYFFWLDKSDDKRGTWMNIETYHDGEKSITSSRWITDKQNIANFWYERHHNLFPFTPSPMTVSNRMDDPKGWDNDTVNT